MGRALLGLECLVAVFVDSWPEVGVGEEEEEEGDGRQVSSSRAWRFFRGGLLYVSLDHSALPQAVSMPTVQTASQYSSAWRF